MSDNEKLGFTVTVENKRWVIKGAPTARILTEEEENFPGMKRAQDIAIKLELLQRGRPSRLSLSDLEWLEKNQTHAPKPISVIPKNPDTLEQMERSFIKGKQKIPLQDVLYQVTEGDTQVGVIKAPEGTKNITLRITEKGEYEIGFSALTANERGQIISRNFKQLNDAKNGNYKQSSKLTPEISAIPFSDFSMTLDRKYLNDMGNQINIEIAGGRNVEFRVTGTQQSKVVPIAIYNKYQETGITFSGDTSTIELHDKNTKNTDALSKINTLRERQEYRKQKASDHSMQLADRYAELTEKKRDNKATLLEADEDRKLRNRLRIYELYSKGELPSQKLVPSSAGHSGGFFNVPDEVTKIKTESQQTNTTLKDLIRDVNTSSRFETNEAKQGLKLPLTTPDLTKKPDPALSSTNSRGKVGAK